MKTPHIIVITIGFFLFSLYSCGRIDKQQTLAKQTIDLSQFPNSWTEVVYLDNTWIIGSGNWHPYIIEFSEEENIKYYSETEPFAVNRYIIKSFIDKDGVIEIEVQPDFDTINYYVRTLRPIDSSKDIYQIDLSAACSGCYFIPTKDTIHYQKKKIYEDESDFEG